MKRHLITTIVITLIVILIIPAGCAQPAEFEKSALNISSAEVVNGEATNVTVDVENIGGSEGTYTVTLNIDGVEVETKEDTLAAGAKETVTWQITEGIGTHQVGVDGLSGSFKVLKPAEFEVVNIDINPNPVKVGGETKITITVENLGDAGGIYEVNMLVDGIVEQTSDVTLAGGATKPVSFVASKDSLGNYFIEIGGREAILKVVQPVRLETGTILVKEWGDAGKAKLKINNRLDSDAVVILTLLRETNIPLFSFYVQSDDSYTAKRIQGGTYFLYITQGEDWDNDSQRFLSRATYLRFEDEYGFR